jgi:hypothetical protein
MLEVEVVESRKLLMAGEVGGAGIWTPGLTLFLACMAHAPQLHTADLKNPQRRRYQTLETIHP